MGEHSESEVSSSNVNQRNLGGGMISRFSCVNPRKKRYSLDLLRAFKKES